MRRKSSEMAEAIRARYHEGKIEPLEPLELPEGSELLVTVTPAADGHSTGDATASTAGAWRELLDCRAFEEDVYATRLLNSRPPVDL
jgi:predicted DNA-binding antitoxin AbrB/MazE fold protein